MNLKEGNIIFVGKMLIVFLMKFNLLKIYILVEIQLLQLLEVLFTGYCSISLVSNLHTDSKLLLGLTFLFIHGYISITFH